MKKFVCVLAVAAAISLPAQADEARSEKEAEAFVARVVKALNANRPGTLSEINAGDKKWVDGELYATINSIDGISLANGMNPKSAGKDISNLTDMNGKEFMKERLELARTKGKLWQEFMWKDPVTKKVQPKQIYCERTGEMIACAGIYKR
ncbi:MAG: cache domain-containing protein [Rhodoferax sp.]|nr:cache domain-containing protein [Rhodoferax sp.]